MKLEDIVTSLELSRKLFELGFKHESLFIWGNIKEFQLKAGLKPTVYYKQCLIKCWNHQKQHIQNALDSGETLSAYTAAELFEPLPHVIHLFNQRFFLQSGKHVLSKTDAFVAYYDSDNDEYLEINEKPAIFREDNLTNGLAKMNIYLIENNLIKL
jgi:hypothetical protein